MPCDSRIEIRISWKNANADRAKAAIKALGINARFQNGEVIMQSYYGSEVDEDSIMQKLNAKYAELTVKEAADKYGWSIEGQFTTQQNEQVFNMVRF